MKPKFNIAEVCTVKRGAGLHIRGVLYGEGPVEDFEGLMVRSLVDRSCKKWGLEVEPEFEVMPLGPVRFAVHQSSTPIRREVQFIVLNPDGVMDDCTRRSPPTGFGAKAPTRNQGGLLGAPPFRSAVAPRRST